MNRGSAAAWMFATALAMAPSAALARGGHGGGHFARSTGGHLGAMHFGGSHVGGGYFGRPMTHVYVGPGWRWPRPHWGRGYWGWGGSAWVWVAAPWWVTPDYPGWVWVAPRWVWDGEKWVWQAGYWAPEP